MRSLLTLILALASSAGAQWTPRLASATDTALVQRLMQFEDARTYSPAAKAAFDDGLRSANADVRRFAVRGLGRLEAGITAPALLADPSADVRSEAAHAHAQSLYSGKGDVAAVREMLRGRLAVETVPSVRGALAESIGRLRATSVTVGDSVATLLAGVLDRATTTVEKRGGVRGASYLMRGRGASIATILHPALFRLTAYGLPERGPNAAADSARHIRFVAVSTLGPGGFGRGGDSLQLLQRILNDPSDEVRSRIPTLIASRDSVVALPLQRRAITDPSALVRYQVVTALARAPDTRCGIMTRSIADPDPAIALRVIDELGRCSDQASAALLDSVLAKRRATPGDWDAAAHALVSLAGIAPARAREALPPFAGHPSQFVRMRAAQVAGKVGDTETAIRLLNDSTPNVVSEAIPALAALLGRGADERVLATLRWDDSQVLRAATAALRGSKDPRVGPALIATFTRVTQSRRQTSRDGRMALLSAIAALADSSVAGQLRPYMLDVDPVVAARVRELRQRWFSAEPSADFALEPLPPPTVAELGLWSRSRVSIVMQAGDTIELRLFPFDAPTNVRRFVQLANKGYFDGLTFHRIVPGFVVQGGSPNANEYSGDGPFTRDELGVENRRGTVGVSTRGRDTGDGQLYFNMVDNISLDHNYTVFAEVVRGMSVVDRLREGAVIRRVVIH